MDLIQLKIEKDNSAVKYIKIIREFDSSLSMGDIKRRIDASDFAMEFDLEDLDVLDELNDIDRKREFRGMIEALKNAGAKVTIFHNGDEESLEFLDNWLESLEEIEFQTENELTDDE